MTVMKYDRQVSASGGYKFIDAIELFGNNLSCQFHGYNAKVVCQVPSSFPQHKAGTVGQTPGISHLLQLERRCPIWYGMHQLSLSRKGALPILQETKHR